MLSTSQHVTLRCARCALRTHIAALRQKRLRTTASADARTSSDHHFPAHMITGGHRFGSRERPSGQDDGYTNSVVRKTWPTHLYRPPRKADTRDRSPPQTAKAQAKEFNEALKSRLAAMKEELRQAPLLQQVANEGKQKKGGDGHFSFSTIWKDFIRTSFAKPASTEIREATGKKETRIVQDLNKHYKMGGEDALDGRIKYHFYAHVTGARFSPTDIKNQRSVADLRYPTEWFPATRTVSRTIHLHVGPTNSGKTYHALQRLENAESGTYAGPLRLLAHEVYTRMNAKGKKCSLITGEEKRLSESSDGTQADELMACTVEMVPLNTTLDVAVIDEIQMINSPERGWAWTQALLGVKAKEVHLCGEERTVPLIQEICATTGEKLEIHRYQRLSPLKMADSSLDGDLSKLRKGDCIVSFSVMGIHALRRQIEKSTGKKVAIVYGSLPPETRAQQARLFNEPNNNYDFLVASDAIGMGLNLAIKRVIFEATTRFDGYKRQTLGVADIKQIAGRAGRFRTAAQVNDKPASEQHIAAAKGDVPERRPASTRPSSDDSVGLVTTMEHYDFPVVKSAMGSEPEPILSAGVQPPAAVLIRFASYFPPGTPFSFILTRLHELSKMHRRFHLCNLRDQVWIADLIEPVEGLTIADRNILTSAPAGRSDVMLWKDLMPAFARCVAQQGGGSIVDIKELPLEVLEAEVSTSREYLRELERLHKGVVTYLWLSYRFAGIFDTRPLAFHVKNLVEERIETVLSSFSFSENRRKKLAAQREKQSLEALQLREEQAAAAAKRNQELLESLVLDEGGTPAAEDPDADDREFRNQDQRDPIDDESDVRTTLDASEPATHIRDSPVEENNADSGLDVDDSLYGLADDVDTSLDQRSRHQATSGHAEDRFDNEEIPLDEPVEFEDDERPKHEEGRKEQPSKAFESG